MIEIIVGASIMLIGILIGAAIGMAAADKKNKEI